MKNQIPLFVINLDSSTEKMTFMQKQLDRLALSFERISAVRGIDLSADEVSSVYSAELNRKRHHRNLSPGEIGCYMSHRKIWQNMLDENIEFAIIIEDDINIEPAFFSIDEHFEKLKQYDLIKLADNRAIKPAKIKSLNKEYELISYHRIPNCTTGYAISLSGARKMLSRKQFFRPVDIDIQFCHELEVSVVGFRPYPVTECADFNSDIVDFNDGRHSNRSTAWRNLRYRAIVWWNRKRRVSAVLK